MVKLGLNKGDSNPKEKTANEISTNVLQIVQNKHLINEAKKRKPENFFPKKIDKEV